MKRVAADPRAVATTAIIALAGLLAAASVWPGSASPSQPAANPSASANPFPSPSPSPIPSPSPSPSPSFDRGAYPLDDPTSPWVVVNKTRPLDPIDYAPTDLTDLGGVSGGSGQELRADAASAFLAMVNAAKAEGVTIRVATAYRSYGDQKAIRWRMIEEKGRWWADRSSARGGYSEHQTGWAVDVYDSDECRLQYCFGRSTAGRWVAEHAWEYGFVLRYPDDSVEITGYIWEPWHLRYVGIELASEMHEAGTPILEVFFGLPAAPNYP